MSLDHGIINVPLHKRYNMDKEIRDAKARQASALAAEEKARITSDKASRAQAKALLEAMTAEQLSALASRWDLTSAAARKRLKHKAHFLPESVIEWLGGAA